MTSYELKILQYAEQWHRQESKNRKNERKKQMHHDYADAISVAIMELKWDVNQHGTGPIFS